MTLLGKSFIGSTRGDDNSKKFHGINPETGARLDPIYHEASLDEVNRAAESGFEAFQSYRKLSGSEKALFLRRIAEETEALGDALISRAQQETSLTEARLKGERARTCDQLRLFANLVEEGSWVDARIDHADPARQPSPKPDTRSLLEAIGPVAVFGPANFPLAFSVAGGDTASALAAGCPVIVKAHSSHPGTSELVGLAVRRAVAACKLPEGVFSLLFGSGRTVGRELVGHPRIKAVGFTGSKRSGRELFNLAANRPEPIPFFGELSSLNPVFLLPGALGERAGKIAEGLHASVTLGVGQFCTNPGLVVLGKSEAAETFMNQFTGLMAKTPSGVMLNATTRETYGAGLLKLGTQAGVEASVRSACDAGAGGAQAGAAVFRSDVKTYLRNSTLAEEVFGPSTLLLTCENGEEMVALANALEGNFTATVHGTLKDFQEHSELLAVLETKVGRLVFNAFPTGVEVCSSMVHGGPYPATTDSRFTSVGTGAIYRFVRPVCYQSCPDGMLPPELQNNNPLKIRRLVNGRNESPGNQT